VPRAPWPGGARAAAWRPAWACEPAGAGARAGMPSGVRDGRPAGGYAPVFRPAGLL
jgi:hypothetical protein